MERAEKRQELTETDSTELKDKDSWMKNESIDIDEVDAAEMLNEVDVEVWRREEAGRDFKEQILDR